MTRRRHLIGGPALETPLLIRPDAKLIAARFAELESPSARECEDWFKNCPACGFHLRLRRFQGAAVENQQGGSIGGQCGLVGLKEPAIEPLARERTVLRAVVHKRPSEGCIPILRTCLLANYIRLCPVFA